MGAIRTSRAWRSRYRIGASPTVDADPDTDGRSLDCSFVSEVVGACRDRLMPGYWSALWELLRRKALRSQTE